MSKGGGAGKVYFVLYLAVVLELLIIIVERDEAEEGLHRKQQETMKIVESILSQLQSGAGTEGINTRPQDEITIPPSGVNLKDVMGADIKSFRKYLVEVGVTDVSGAIKRKEGETEKEHLLRIRKLVELANVDQLQYQVFFNSSQDPASAPIFPSEEALKDQGIDFMNLGVGATVSDPREPGSSWEFMGVQELLLDKEATFNNLDIRNITASSLSPIYKPKVLHGPSFVPSGQGEDKAFYYNDTLSRKSLSAGSTMKKRVFEINFQPPNRPGWYKLRFASRTNRILGISAAVKPAELSDEATVNIGTVQLTVRDLRRVQKELSNTLEKYQLPGGDVLIVEQNIDKFEAGLARSRNLAMKEDNATEVIGKINLYGYIIKLLAPGQSINFEQNKGAMEFNIRVITPKPQLAEPAIVMQTYVASFDKIPAAFEFSVSPYQEGQNAIEGRVIDNNKATVARITFQPRDQIAGSGVTAPVRGGTRLYQGTVSQTLSPGKYQIEITHKLSGKSRTEVGDLEIFPTRLTPESEKDIKNRFKAYTFYGYPVQINAVPSSGGKIKPDQFRLYITTDNNSQRPPIQGLVTEKDNVLTLKPDSKKVSLRVTWVQPYTGQEVDLLSTITEDIKQEEPKISVRNLTPDVTGTAATVKITVRGVQISPPGTGSDKPAKVQVKIAGEPKVDITGYSSKIEPTIDEEGDGKYVIYLELGGKLERGKDRISGTVTIPISAVAVNPVNGVRSDPQPQQIQIPINFSPERGGPQRRR